MSAYNSIVQVNNSVVTYAASNDVSAAFKDKGTYSVRADCGANLTISSQCHLLVSLALYGPNLNLYTKSITLKLTNNRGSLLAVGTNTYASPPQQYQIGYGLEPPSTILVMINMPSVAPMGTWTFDIIQTNPPFVNSQVLLNLGLGARVAENQPFGRTYDLYATAQLPRTG